MKVAQPQIDPKSTPTDSVNSGTDFGSNSTRGCSEINFEKSDFTAYQNEPCDF